MICEEYEKIGLSCHSRCECGVEIDETGEMEQKRKIRSSGICTNATRSDRGRRMEG